MTVADRKKAVARGRTSTHWSLARP